MPVLNTVVHEWRGRSLGGQRAPYMEFLWSSWMTTFRKIRSDAD